MAPCRLKAILANILCAVLQLIPISISGHDWSGVALQPGSTLLGSPSPTKSSIALFGATSPIATRISLKFPVQSVNPSENNLSVSP
eukprot:15354552-Ditylum_brightwellii.AAC.1